MADYYRFGAATEYNSSRTGRGYPVKERIKHGGRFALSADLQVLGELTLDGPRTELYLRHQTHFTIRDIENRYVSGALHDLTKVSLIDCTRLRDLGTARRGDESFHYATLLPHFVVYGDRHLGPSEEAIISVRFFVDDAGSLFYDFDAFGDVLKPERFIEQIAHANDDVHKRQIKTGPNPIITYFTGKLEIISVRTPIGLVSARHNPTYDMGWPMGAKLSNRISITLKPPQAVSFDRAISDVRSLLRFLELVAGRPQNVLELTVEIQSNEGRPLEVYWSMFPKREGDGDEGGPSPGDIPVDAVHYPEEFSRVLTSWLENDSPRLDARSRYSASLHKRRSYTIDRLVGSANMFDILPDNAVPAEVPLTEELREAKSQCRDIFRRLPESPERNSVLGALGRVGQASLRQKVRHRAGTVLTQLERALPELLTVVDHAVDCRNHYVHGSKSKIDYSQNNDLTIFLTDTFEFIFAASDLIDAGWDANRWAKQGTTLSHPFGRYLVNYKEGLRRLQALIPKAR